MYEYRAKIIKVYDGDTVTGMADLGFNVKIKVKLRLLGINTPEVRGEQKQQGLISKARVVELILDKDVIIKTQKDKTGKYGRWLAEIFLPDSDKSINTLLLEEGLAEPY